MALRTFGSWLYEGLGQLTEAGIRQRIHLCGRRLAKAEVPWLDSPTGPRGRIGEGFYRRIAEERGLTIRPAGADVGLVPDFDALRGPDFDPRRVRPEVRHFYEHTARYDLEAWSAASVLTRPFLWLLVTFVSRRMDQLSFPVSPLETSRGMTSEILTLADAGTGAVAYTGWLRKLAGTGRVSRSMFPVTASHVLPGAMWPGHQAIVGSRTPPSKVPPLPPRNGPASPPFLPCVSQGPLSLVNTTSVFSVSFNSRSVSSVWPVLASASSIQSP